MVFARVGLGLGKHQRLLLGLFYDMLGFLQDFPGPTRDFLGFDSKRGAFKNDI